MIRPQSGLSALSRSLLAAGSLLLSGILAISAAGKPAPPLKLQELSGEWSGTHKTIVAGDCLIRSGGAGAYRDNNPTTFRLSVDASGSFTAIGGCIGAIEDCSLTWSGTIDTDLELIASSRSIADCFGAERDVRTDYIGRVRVTSKKLKLDFEGTSVACPQQQCEFKEIYKLSRPVTGKGP